MADDTTKDGSGEFDDWLDEEPGPPTDPKSQYADLGSDDADEIAEWMAFTGGSPSKPQEPEPASPRESEPKPEPVDEVVAETGEIEVAAVLQDAPDEVAEADVAEAVAGGPIEDAETVEIDALEMDAMATEDDDDDTGEIELVPIAPFGGFTSEPEPIPPQSRELFDLSSSEYVSTATTEHSDLAEAVAAASAQDTEQVPIAAPIPGMTDTVVGFEDVVAAEGIGRARTRASGDLIARVVTAVVLVAALGASLIWQPVLAIFALVVFVLGASEFYTSLVRADHKPIGIFGFIGIIGASVGAYFWGSLAIPMAFVVAVALLLLYYAVVPGKTDPLGNLALTITVMVWVGLGSYTMLIVVSDSYRPLVIGVVVAVAAMDTAQYFIGRAIGRTPLSPWVSPKKTVEGLVAGIFVAMLVGALLHFVEPFELTSGLALGAAVAILAPLGDLAMSAAKRALGLKDMGSVLPGHGGFLDRIDGLLFVIPAAWLVFLWAGIL